MSKDVLIIMGNLKRKTDDIIGMDTLYYDLCHYFKVRGYNPHLWLCDHDPRGKFPDSCDVWVGHSKGTQWLCYAPKNAKVIAMGINEPDAINHPDDIVDLETPDDFDKLPLKARQAHFDWHPSFEEKLDKILKESVVEDNVIDFEAHIPHCTQTLRCVMCDFTYVSVFPECLLVDGSDRINLECAKCKKITENVFV